MQEKRRAGTNQAGKQQAVKAGGGGDRHGQVRHGHGGWRRKKVDPELEEVRTKQNLLQQLTRQAEINSRILERERAMLLAMEIQTLERDHRTALENGTTTTLPPFFTEEPHSSDELPHAMAPPPPRQQQVQPARKAPPANARGGPRPGQGGPAGGRGARPGVPQRVHNFMHQPTHIVDPSQVPGLLGPAAMRAQGHAAPSEPSPFDEHDSGPPPPHLGPPTFPDSPGAFRPGMVFEIPGPGAGAHAGQEERQQRQPQSVPRPPPSAGPYLLTHAYSGPNTPPLDDVDAGAGLAGQQGGLMLGLLQEEEEEALYTQDSTGLGPLVPPPPGFPDGQPAVPQWETQSGRANAGGLSRGPAAAGVPVPGSGFAADHAAQARAEQLARQQAYRRELEEQIAAKKEREAAERAASGRAAAAADAWAAAAPPPWHPTAQRRGGGGEPLRDASGAPIADLRRRGMAAAASGQGMSPGYPAQQQIAYHQHPPEPFAGPRHPTSVALQDPHQDAHWGPAAQQPYGTQHPAWAAPEQPQAHSSGSAHPSPTSNGQWSVPGGPLSPSSNVGGGPAGGRFFMAGVAQLVAGPSEEQRRHQEAQRAALLRDLDEQVRQKKEAAARRKAEEDAAAHKEEMELAAHYARLHAEREAERGAKAAALPSHPAHLLERPGLGPPPEPSPPPALASKPGARSQHGGAGRRVIDADWLPPPTTHAGVGGGSPGALRPAAGQAAGRSQDMGQPAAHRPTYMLPHDGQGLSPAAGLLQQVPVVAVPQLGGGHTEGTLQHEVSSDPLHGGGSAVAVALTLLHQEQARLREEVSHHTASLQQLAHRAQAVAVDRQLAWQDVQRVRGALAGGVPQAQARHPSAHAPASARSLAHTSRDAPAGQLTAMNQTHQDGLFMVSTHLLPRDANCIPSRLPTPLEAEWAVEREPLLVKPPAPRRAWAAYAENHVRVAAAGEEGDDAWDDVHDDTSANNNDAWLARDQVAGMMRHSSATTIRSSHAQPLQAVQLGLFRPLSRGRGGALVAHGARGAPAAYLPTIIPVDGGPDQGYGYGMQLDDGHQTWQPALVASTRRGTHGGVRHAGGRFKDAEDAVLLPVLNAGRRAARVKPPPSPAILRADILRSSPARKMRPHRSAAPSVPATRKRAPVPPAPPAVAPARDGPPVVSKRDSAVGRRLSALAANRQAAAAGGAVRAEAAASTGVDTMGATPAHDAHTAGADLRAHTELRTDAAGLKSLPQSTVPLPAIA